MRVVLCDEDALLRDVTEGLITRLGHDLVGVADTTVSGVALIEAARPDLVVFDLSLGYNTDFDVIEAALACGSKVLIFSHNADEAILGAYPIRPSVVHKPDLVALEDALSRVMLDDTQKEVVERDRRGHPGRAATGPPATHVADAQAFYEALNGLREHDALVSIDLDLDAAEVGEEVLDLVRSTDRLVASRSSVRVYLPDGGSQAIEAVLERLARAEVVPPGARVHSIVVEPGEDATDAFERLKG
ncbi:MAG: hypothetical protein ACT4OV_12480 [Microthrixaceae bacterium]